MPTTRVIYLEPDPCLRRFMTTFLADCEEIEVVATVGSADEVLARSDFTDGCARATDRRVYVAYRCMSRALQARHHMYMATRCWGRR